MANLTVKDVPDRIHKELKDAARERGSSLNSYVVSLLQESVSERVRRRAMRERWPEFEKFLAGLPRFDDNASLIREDRLLR